MNDKYLVIEASTATDLETELNKDDYAAYEVVSVTYTDSKLCAVLKKVYY